MRSFVRKHQRYALAGGQGRKQLYLYEADDPLSVMWARLQVANRKPGSRDTQRGKGSSGAARQGGDRGSLALATTAELEGIPRPRLE
jgi:hypothetical protein